jgi:anti-sigma factor (TIGR02949 family)
MMNTKDDQHHDIGCLQAIEAFYAYLDGELEDPKSIEEFEDHMKHCRSCYSRADVEKLLNRRISESAKTQAPKMLQNRLRKLMDEFD